MKKRTLLTVAAAVVVGYLFAKDKAQKERVKLLVKQDAFENYSDENATEQMNIHWIEEEN